MIKYKYRYLSNNIPLLLTIAKNFLKQALCNYGILSFRCGTKVIIFLLIKKIVISFKYTHIFRKKHTLTLFRICILYTNIKKLLND